MKKLFEIQIRFFIGEFVVNLSHSEKIESIVNFTNSHDFRKYDQR